MLPLAVVCCILSTVETPVGVDLSTSPGRSGGALVGALVAGVATAVTSTALFLAFAHETDDSFIPPGAPAAVISSLLGTMLCVPLGAFFGHVIAGGSGSYGAAVAGSALGVLAGGAMMGLGMVALGQDSRAGAAVFVALGFGAMIAGPIVGLELSHRSLTSRLAPTVGVAPRKRGGTLVASWVI